MNEYDNNQPSTELSIKAFHKFNIINKLSEPLFERNNEQPISFMITATTENNSNFLFLKADNVTS